MIATTADAYQLFHEGSIALAQVEANGIRIDTGYLDKQIVRYGKKILKLEEKLKKDEIYAAWQKEFGAKTKLGSSDQLGKVLFDVLHIPYKTEHTSTGRYKTGRVVLERIDLPFVQDYLQLENLKKDKSTFLEGIKTETVDGYLHPFFHLASGGDNKGGARSYRSSSSNPNFQNFPARDKERSAVIRRCFIPRDGHQILEVDFKGIEVGISCVYHHDPTLISYVKDNKKDMHRDMARQIYFIDPKQEVTKNTRNSAKAAFVFAQFYGDYYINCAVNLWDRIGKDKLTLIDGTPLIKHLKKHGIRKRGSCDPEQRPAPGTFERHVKEVEDDFWNKRFPVYTAWKKKWYQDYLETGSITYLTGFRVEGEYSRNQILNLPIQGTAFHCLLWTLIKLQAWLVKHRMKSKIVGQIHDSLIIDAYASEVPAILEKIDKLVKVGLPKHWPWIIVPLSVEAELAPLGASWFEKKAIVA